MADVKGIQSVEIAGEILDAVVEAPRPLRLKEIAAATGLSASKARAYLVSLLRVGLIDQESATSLYMPGRKALRLGLLALGQDRLIRAARRVMAEIGTRTGDPLLLSVWDRDRSMIVAAHESTGPLPMTFRVGSMTPLNTATGMVFLAHLPEAVAERAAAEHLPPEAWRSLPATLATVRAAGYAAAATVRLNADAAISGYGAIAAPIFGQGGRIELVLTALHPSSIPPDAYSREIEVVRAGAAEACAEAGFAIRAAHP